MSNKRQSSFRGLIMSDSHLEARLCASFTDVSSFTALDNLKSAGFTVSFSACEGMLEPEVTVGSESYSGLDQIDVLINSLGEDGTD